MTLLARRDGDGDAQLRQLGPSVPLRRPASVVRGYVFCARFDGAAGSVLSVRTDRRMPLDLLALGRRPRAPTRPLRPTDAPLLVRTVGPDSQYIGVHAHPASGVTVGDVRAAVASRLGYNAADVGLRIAGADGRQLVHAPAQCEALTEEAATKEDRTPLADVGVRIEFNGAHAHRLDAHISLLVS